MVQKENKVIGGKHRSEGKDSEVDEAINFCFSAVLAVGIRISEPLLKSKTKELAQMLGRMDFVATDGWVSSWKVRHQIKYKIALG